MGGLELIERIERCHELLTMPVPLSVNDMVAIETANPVKVQGQRDAFSIAHELRGWSRGECKRRGVTISDTFATPISTLTWASVKMGKNDYEPVYFDGLQGSFLERLTHGPTHQPTGSGVLLCVSEQP